MIDYYDTDRNTGNHTIRVTFMEFEYKGHIAFVVGGNVKGADLLNVDFLGYCDEDDIAAFAENDCQLELNHSDENNCYFTAVLKDEFGNSWDVEEDFNGMKNLIVGLEVIAFEKEA